MFSAFCYVFFKPSKYPHLRLRAIGFSNHTSCIGALPTLTQEENSHLVKCLVGLRHKFTRNSTTLWAQDQFELPARRLSLRGAIPDFWLSKCSLFSAFDNARVAERLAGNGSDLPAAPNSADIWLNCPVGLHIQDCTNTTLVKGALFKPVHCKTRHCRVTRSSAKWICSCDKLWYTCEIHAAPGHAAG